MTHKRDVMLPSQEAIKAAETIFYEGFKHDADDTKLTRMLTAAYAIDFPAHQQGELTREQAQAIQALQAQLDAKDRRIAALEEAACEECNGMQQLQAKLERYHDLVRYQRAELHEAELISDKEYAELLSDSKSVDRLHGYDELRERADRLQAEVERLENRLFSLGEMTKAPCFCCGYNGPYYFQVDTHPCVARHHRLFIESPMCV